jgi:hypothetical protein
MGGASASQEAAEPQLFIDLFLDVGKALAAAGVLAGVKAGVKRWRAGGKAPPRRIIRTQAWHFHENGTPRRAWIEEAEEPEG